MSSPNSPRRESAPEDEIILIARGFMGSRILFAGYELGIFTELEEGGKSSEDVARKIDSDPRATNRLMHALVALGLLEKDSDLFYNSPGASQCLVEGKTEYLSNLQHTIYTFSGWTTLTEAVRQGTSVYECPGGEEGEKRTAAFIEAMDYLSKRRAKGLISHLDLTGVGRVLDVGGGSGENAMEFARTGDDVEVTVFDLPDVVHLTDGYIERAGLSERVRTVAGDYHCDGLGDSYDMVLLSQIIHSNSPDENAELIQKCADALNEGGRLVIQDFIVDEDRSGPPWAVVFALNMLVATETGDTYTENEMGDVMTRAGFSDIERIDTDFGTTLIIGVR
ncbi:MAG: methyltransferase domain-containing protein [bacterium]|nr:methyltransferase domain-containing protein [bacterium]